MLGRLRHSVAPLAIALALLACGEPAGSQVVSGGKVYLLNLPPARIALGDTGPVDPRDPGSQPLRLERRFTLAEQLTRRALVQLDDQPLVFRGVVPEQGTLSFALGFALRGHDAPDRFVMEIAVRAPGAEPGSLGQVVFREEVRRPSGRDDSRWWERELALSGPAGADLLLRTSIPGAAPGRFPECDVPAWGNPVLRSAGHALDVHAAGRPNVVVVLVDTLRRDRLGTYGHHAGVSPNIDALAPESVVFDTARSVTSWTMPAVASLFTGALPSAHGTQRYTDHLDPAAVTLAECFADAGWRTAAVGGSEWVFNPAFGLDRGFQRSLYVMRGHALEHVPAGAVIDETLAWLDRNVDQPFLLYVHLTDPHAPYTPPPGWDRFGDPAYDGPINGLNLGDDAFLERDAASVSPADLARLASLYDGEVAYADAQIGRLVERLRELDLWDETTFVVTSDHGEEFLEHGGWTHGATLYEEQLAIPLLLKPPASAGIAPHREARTVSLLHLGHALCGLAGVPVSDGPLAHGDLLPKLLGDEGGLDEQIVSELAKPGFAAWSVRRRVVKYVRSFEPEERTQVFLVDADPGETDNLLGYLDEPTQAELERRAQAWRQRVLASEGASTGLELDAEAARQLRTLGYVEGR